MTSLGKAVALARAKKGFSLRELARHTGIQNSHLSELETGKRSNPEWRTMVKLAKALGLKLDRLARCAKGDTKP